MPKQIIFLKKPLLKTTERSSLKYNCCNINGVISIQPCLNNFIKRHKVETLNGYRKTLDCNCNNGESVRIFRDNCCKANSVPKSASTKLLKNYYTNSAELMKARCKTYDQHLYKLNLTNQSNGAVNNCCSQSCPSSNNCSKSYFKPNNKNFSVQGGVSSSTRTSQLKYNIVSSAGTDPDNYNVLNRFSILQKQFPCKSYPKHHKNKCV